MFCRSAGLHCEDYQEYRQLLHLPEPFSCVFFDNLPVDMTEEDAQTFFCQTGEVLCVVFGLNERKGSGYVTFSSCDEAKEAIDVLNGYVFESEGKESEGGGGGGERGEEEEGENRLRIGFAC